MVCQPFGEKPLAEQIVTQSSDAYMCQQTSIC